MKKSLPALLCAIVGCHHDVRPTQVSTTYSPALVQRLARMTLGRDLTDERATAIAEQLRQHPAELEQTIDALVDDPRFADVMAQQLLLGTWQQPMKVDIMRRLKTTSTPAGDVYSLSGKPCADPVRVHPWWALDREVLVCRDSYRPDTRVSASGESCLASTEPQNLEGCGCGPNLVMCAKDDAQISELVDALVDEVDDTIADATRNDRPLEWLYTENESVRKPLAEFHYERSALLEGDANALHDLKAWPQDGKLAPRPETRPGQHAGLLTAQRILYMREGHRVRQVIYGELLWCIQTRAVRTDVEAILALGHGNFRDGDQWDHLAGLPFCTNCHARMDYGHQFFAGYHRGVDGWLYNTSTLRTGTGPLFLRDKNDPRGEAELTPAGFAKLAVAQPEFGQCMVTRVGQHVLGGGWDRPAYVKLMDTYAHSGHALRPLMKAALALYVERALTPATPTTAKREEPAPLANGVVRLSPTTNERVERLCSTCHGNTQPDLSEEALQRGVPHDLVVRMLNQVAMRTMPKSVAPSMNDAELRSFVDELVDAAFTDAATRSQARAYYAQLLGGHVELPRTILTGDDPRGDSALPMYLTVESRVRRDDMRYTPGLMTLQEIAAARRCRAQKLAGAQLDACIERGVDVDAATH